MKFIFIANEFNSEFEGISKKIHLQAAAVSRSANSCELLIKSTEGVLSVTYINGLCAGKKIVTSKLSHLSEYKQIKLLANYAYASIVHEDDISIYIRHIMRPSLPMVSLVKYAKKMGIRVFYEIPTYPFFKEQLYASNRKLLTFSRLVIEKLYLTFFFRYVSTIFFVKSNTKIKKRKKMVEIVNGFNLDDKSVWIKPDITNEFHIIGVGTIYKYHGYERLIKAIISVKGYTIDKRKVFFHIIGESDEVSRLKKIYSKYEEIGILFHGVKKGIDLDSLFNKAHLAVGSLDLYRRGANIDTTLKVVEYMCRGIPFVSSGYLPKGFDYPYIKINNNTNHLNFNQIYDSTLKLYDNFDFIELSSEARKSFDWFKIVNEGLK
jgi:glycosyltransferase involved in cell wall biosynthesis